MRDASVSTDRVRNSRSSMKLTAPILAFVTVRVVQHIAANKVHKWHRCQKWKRDSRLSSSAGRIAEPPPGGAARASEDILPDGFFGPDRMVPAFGISAISE